MFELKNDLKLIPGKTVCPRCYMQVTNIKNLEPQSPRNEENDQLDFVDNGDVTPFSIERVITPRRVSSFKLSFSLEVLFQMPQLSLPFPILIKVTQNDALKFV